MRVFLTGFGPFNSITHNPSGALAESAGLPFTVLETSFEAVDEFVDSLHRANWDALLMIGVAANSRVQRLERLAHNAVGSSPDVRGVARPGCIVSNGPHQLQSTLWKRGDVQKPGCRWSDDAGTYLCNYLYYRVLSTHPNLAAGFLHIPPCTRMKEAEQHARLQSLLSRIAARQR